MPAFQSTLLMRGATSTRQPTRGPSSHFNPRSSCEERRPVGTRLIKINISIHAPHARSDSTSADSAAVSTISIHAPHARSDSADGRNRVANSISIHAPHARSDLYNLWRAHKTLQFQSTLLMRGATVSSLIGVHPSLFQSTLLMRGATRDCRNLPADPYQFQSTLLMRGATTGLQKTNWTRFRFQSTLLMRGATLPGHGRIHPAAQISIHAPHARSDHARPVVAVSPVISIHAPHARSDASAARNGATASNFNPRSSCEERLKTGVMQSAPSIFQSTLLMRGATRTLAYPSNTDVFQSTLLMRGATSSTKIASACRFISIHAPHARSDRWMSGRTRRSALFQSTLLMRGATLDSHTP